VFVPDDAYIFYSAAHNPPRYVDGNAKSKGSAIVPVDCPACLTRVLPCCLLFITLSEKLAVVVFKLLRNPRGKQFAFGR